MSRALDHAVGRPGRGERAALRLARLTAWPGGGLVAWIVTAVLLVAPFLVVVLGTGIRDSPWYVPFFVAWLVLLMLVGPVLGGAVTGWYRDRPLTVPHERLARTARRRYRRVDSWVSTARATPLLDALEQRCRHQALETRRLDGGLWMRMQCDLPPEDVAGQPVRQQAAADVLVLVDGAAGLDVDGPHDRAADPGAMRPGSGIDPIRITVHHGRRRDVRTAQDGGLTALMDDRLVATVRDCAPAH